MKNISYHRYFFDISEYCAMTCRELTVYGFKITLDIERRRTRTDLPFRVELVRVEIERA